MTDAPVAAPGSDPGVEPLAIIGLAVRVPGASNAAEFWQNLIDGRESVTFFDAETQRALGATEADLAHPDWVPAAPVIDQLEYFDAELFGISPREAELADPQHRVFLEVAHSALEDAGYDPARYPQAVGVYAGTGTALYEWFNLRANRKLWGEGLTTRLSVSTVNAPDYVATLLSYKLNLRGPSLTVHTACSTSMVALHLACEAIRNGECSMALAGGVCVELPNGRGYISVEGYTSPDGHCRPFDADAQGTLWGSGAGVVLVKRLADALADGDQIRAVVRGNAINNDGSDKAGFSAPSVTGQAEVVAQALAVAGIDPRSVSYLESHGTGTSLGDPIEVSALTEAYGAGQADRQWCALGSVKSNFGHLSQAAGIVGVIKTVLALEHRIIPPSLNFRRPNPAIDFPTTPFYVATAPTEFGAQPRRAGVSSFGIGGTNAHIVLEEPPSQGAPPPVSPPTSLEPASPAQSLAAPAGSAPALLQLSAASPAALESAVTNLAEHLDAHPELPLGSVAHTLRVGRTPRRHRAAVVANDPADAIAALRDPGRRLVDRAAASQVGLLFSGQGAQRAGMGEQLYRTEPAFAAAVNECRAACPELATPADDLEQTQHAQPALFIVEYALARLWESWGVRPAAMLGHSIGEYVAATLAGVFALPDALRLVVARGRLMQSTPPGAMYAVPLAEGALADRLPSELVIAAVNGPESCVVAGPVPAAEAFAASLAEDGIRAHRLRTSHAFHSPMLDPILAQFRQAVAGVPRAAPAAPFLSNLTGTWIEPEQATDPGYWVDHLRAPVRFGDGVATLLADRESGCLLECGPGRQLVSLARKQLPREGWLAVPSLPDPPPSGEDGGPAGELASVLGAAGRLWTAGVPVEVPSPAGARRVSLPTYPYQRVRYWVDPDPVAAAEPAAGTGAAVPAGAAASRPLPPAEWYAVPAWRQLPPDPRREPIERCLLVVAGPRGEALAAQLRAAGSAVTAIAPADTPEPLPGRVIHAAALDGDPAGTDPAALAAAQQPGLFSALGLVQAAAATGESVHIDLVSTGTEDVAPGALTRPEHATLAGIARVAPLDVPGLTVRRIDVDPSTTTAELVAELSRPPEPAPSEVVLQGGRRWTREYDQVSLPEPAPEPELAPGLRPGGCYLITGGLGGIGLTIAEDLAGRTGGRLVLVSRSGLPDRADWDDQLVRRGVGDRAGRAIAAIRRIERAGATVQVLAADVADPAELRRVRQAVAAARGEDGSEPLVHGIIHAAGVPSGRLVQVADPEAVAAVLRPKLAGTLALASAFGIPDSPAAPDFLLLCSSITAVAGGLGQVDYCAANAFLDAYARSVAGGRTRVVSVNWGGWAEVGMAAEYGSGGRPALDHPVLTDRAASSVSGVIEAGTHWLLDEHRLAGVPVVPGTAHLECARAAIARLLPPAGPAAVVELSDVVFTEPFAVPDQAPRRYAVAVEPDRAGAARFRVTDPAGRVYAQGTGRHVEPDPAPVVDIAAIRERCRPVDPATGGGSSLLAFGERWRCLAEHYQGDGEELAFLAAPQSAKVDWDRWVLHPALLDIATSFGGSGREPAPYLPLEYGRVLVRGPLPDRCYSYLRYADRSADGLVTVDVTVTDPRGRVLVEIGEFTLRRVDPDQVSGLDPAGSGPPEAAPEAAAPSQLIPPAEGARALRRLLGTDLGPQVIVHPVAARAVIARTRTTTSTAASTASAESPAARPPAVAGGESTPPEARERSAATPPRTELEAQLVRAWQEVLKVEPIGVDDDFFELGGDSIVAVQLITAIRSVVRAKVPMRALFDTPTVAKLAERIGQLRAAALEQPPEPPPERPADRPPDQPPGQPAEQPPDQPADPGPAAPARPTIRRLPRG